MEVSAYIWTLTIAGIVGLLAFDFFFHVRKAHTPSLKESATWSAIYVGIAVLFGLAVLVFGGPDMGTEYFAGYVTEKALSVDNLFVFLIIMASFKVPRADQQKVLLFGIVFSLIARTAFIFLGAALINSFAWVFYIFGLILLLTAGNLLKPDSHDDDSEGLVVRLARKLLPASQHYDGDKLFTVENGKRVLTPMLLVMVAIGGTDILFALDSIPAIFGLTQNVFIVFTATAFSLMGLRQLFFLIDGLLDRLIFLSYGLAVILGFIGVKLILHALHENTLPFINDGKHVNVVEVSTVVSLGVILGVLVVTILASIFSPKGKAKNAVSGARRHATEYMDLNYETDMAERDKIFAKMCREENQIRKLPEKYKRLVRNETEFMELLRNAHAEHDKAQVRAAAAES
ncbi:TerC family protein [Arthrobacter sp. FX8]|uniref:TerC family protein n=1 Tax=Micrococcaceae TaxID=1268 RepID=UPI000362146B|nr:MULTISPECIES: TerC family protein [unclassified Arthrobacter]KRE75913.1 transporter [Arthrobacter sp. Soil761]TWD48320.1 tellurite resistance protein TerC [Arthrobacter sp. AG367]WAJ33685.1 TerC family protein [Arthrobacter sp. FX8]BCW53509.1 tellurium resistance protein [Arthrobacter sp. StoSoilB19]BCW74594.1 tellurium resistance protein [Arthrobacter sp. NicSoilB11]